MKKIALLLALALAMSTMGFAGLAEEAAEETARTEAPEEIREERQAAALPEVLSATAEKTIVQAGQPVQFTVKTPAYAKFLALFSENGTKCKVWGMTGNSTDDGETRTWTVSYAFKGVGERKITFRTSTTKTYGPDSEKVRVSVKKYVEPMTIKITYTPKAICTGIVNGFYLETSANVNYIHVFAENGAKLNVTTRHCGEPTPVGTREWILIYSIKNPGFRTLTFKASSDGKTYGAETTYEVMAEPAVFSVQRSKNEARIGETVSFTVTTHKAAKYLSVSRDGKANFKIWNASQYSTLVNGQRIWSVEFPMEIANAARTKKQFKYRFCAGLTRDVIYMYEASMGGLCIITKID